MTTELQNLSISHQAPFMSSLLPSTAGTPVPSSLVTPGRPRVVKSSASLPWNGLLVERHLYSPGANVERWTDRHVVSLLLGRPSRFEQSNESFTPMAYVEAPGNLTVAPPGPVPVLRLQTPAEFVHCALTEEFVGGVLAEMEKRPTLNPTFRTGLRNSALRSILELLMAELEAQSPDGRLYAESLAHALATRYLMLNDRPSLKSESNTSPLPLRILNRVREQIGARLCEDVSLAALAKESGYSRAHFLRMFRAATGLTPHQYILEVRLDHARQWLGRKNTSLIDIAAYCGFSSQSHMTSVFQKRLGVTPAQFRRTC